MANPFGWIVNSYGSFKVFHAEIHGSQRPAQGAVSSSVKNIHMWQTRIYLRLDDKYTLLPA
jgi:hypothetical protein